MEKVLTQMIKRYEEQLQVSSTGANEGAVQNAKVRLAVLRSLLKEQASPGNVEGIMGLIYGFWISEAEFKTLATQLDWHTLLEQYEGVTFVKSSHQLPESTEEVAAVYIGRLGIQMTQDKRHLIKPAFSEEQLAHYREQFMHLLWTLITFYNYAPTQDIAFDWHFAVLDTPQG